MTAQTTSVANAFETTLTAAVTSGDLTFPVGTVGTLTSPCYLVIDPDNPTKREYVLFDGTFTATDFVTTSTANRGLTGSSSGAQSHAKGAKVRSSPLAQHVQDLNDRVDLRLTETESNAAYRTVVKPIAHGGIGDAANLTDAAITSGDNTLTAASASFSAADVGKTILVVGAGTPSGGAARNLYTTIASLTSASEVELTDVAGATVSAADAWYGTDDTTALEAAFAAAESAGTSVDLSGGKWLYAGSGYDPTTNSWRITGDGVLRTFLVVAADVYLIAQSTFPPRSIHCEGMTVIGGKGLLNVSNTGATTGPTTGRRVFHGVHLRHYTECGIQTNSTDSPFWEIDGQCLFSALTDSGTIGFAHAGAANQSHIKALFQKNQIHCKLVQSDDVSVDGSTFLWTSGTDLPSFRASLWVVPETGGGGKTTGDALHVVGTKFGNENQQATDYRVLYADEAVGSDVGTRLPDVSTPSTGDVTGHVFTASVISSGTASPRAFIYSMTPNVKGLSINSCPVTGTTLPNLLELDSGATTPSDPSVAGNRVRQARRFGAAQALSNINGWLRDLDQEIEPRAFKPSDESVTSSTSVQQDDDLVLTLGVGTWAFTGFLPVEGDSAADIRLQWSGPVDATGDVSFFGQAGTATAATGSVNTQAVGRAVQALRGTIGTGTVLGIQVSGFITIVTAGDVFISWAQVTSSATPTTIKAGAWIQARRLDR